MLRAGDRSDDRGSPALGAGAARIGLRGMCLSGANPAKSELRTTATDALTYKGISLDGGYRIDLVVDDCVLVELKTVDTCCPSTSLR